MFNLVLRQGMTLAFAGRDAGAPSFIATMRVSRIVGAFHVFKSRLGQLPSGQPEGNGGLNGSPFALDSCRRLALASNKTAAGPTQIR